MERLELLEQREPLDLPGLKATKETRDPRAHKAHLDTQALPDPLGDLELLGRREPQGRRA